MIDTSKETYQRYQTIARKLYARRHRRKGAVVDEVRVPLNANVQVTDEGAFVEAVVWVPKEKLT